MNMKIPPKRMGDNKIPSLPKKPPTTIKLSSVQPNKMQNANRPQNINTPIKNTPNQINLRGEINNKKPKPVNPDDELIKESLDTVKSIIREGITPLEIMTLAMRGDKSITRDMLNAARAAAPYVHPKLSSVVLDNKNSKNLDDLTTEEIEALYGK